MIDNKKFISNKYYSKLMQKEEKLFWSGSIIRTNHMGGLKEGLLILTNKRLIHVGKQHIELFNIFSSLIKREILLEDIVSITYSLISNNFVLHLPKSFDFQITSSHKNQLICKILELKQALNHPILSFYFVEDIDLSKYSKGKKDKQD